MMPTLLAMALWAQMQNPGGPPFGPGGPPFGPGRGGPPPGAAGALAAVAACYFLVIGLIVVFSIIVHWKIFTKAGEPGWAAIVPVYNMLVMARICGRPEIFGLVYLFVPCVGFLIMCLDLASAFGKDAGFGVGLFLLGIVFFPILAFGNSEHVLSRRGRRRRSRHIDDEDDRPRRRRPADDDDEDDDRPRRRAVRQEEDDDDRPRRRPTARDDRVRRNPDDDAPRPRRRPADDDDDDDPPPRPRRRRVDDDD